jgi:hypothetical protein
MTEYKDIVTRLREATKRNDLPTGILSLLCDSYAEIVLLEKRILDLKEGFEGGCYLCEVVGEMNKKLLEEVRGRAQ